MAAYSFAVLPIQQSCLSFSCCDIIVTPARSVPCPPSHFLPRQEMSCPKGLLLTGESVGGQGHTCVHYIGPCVSPWSVVEVGHQSRPLKKSVETNCCKGSDTQGTFLGSCVLSLCPQSRRTAFLFSAPEQLPAGPRYCCDWSNCVPCSCTDPCVTATPVQWPCVDWVISHVSCVQITPARWGRGEATCNLSRQLCVCCFFLFFLTHMYGWCACAQTSTLSLYIYLSICLSLSLSLFLRYKKSVCCENTRAHTLFAKGRATCWGWTTVGV